MFMYRFIAHTYEHTHTHTCAHKLTHTCAHKLTHTCAHTLHTHVHTHYTHMCTHITHTCAHTCAHTHVHTHVHTHMCTHTHTHTHKDALAPHHARCLKKIPTVYTVEFKWNAWGLIMDNKPTLNGICDLILICHSLANNIWP